MYFHLMVEKSCVGIDGGLKLTVAIRFLSLNLLVLRCSPLNKIPVTSVGTGMSSISVVAFASPVSFNSVLTINAVRRRYSSLEGDGGFRWRCII